VESVAKFGSDFLGKIVVVDNCSTDGSAAFSDGLPSVTLIECNQNLGFAKACNIGAAYTSGDFLLFLNPDAQIYPSSLTVALEFMNSPENTKVGICGVQLIDEDGHIARSCARFPTPLNLLLHALGIDRFVPSFGHAMLDWDHKSTREVDHVIGAFFLVRREVFEILHGFDERFFVYLEDLDFSYRASQQGWKSVYLASAQAFHVGGGASRQVKARRLFYSIRSRILYSAKHFRLIQAFAVAILSLVVEPFARSALALARASWTSLKETWVAYGLLYRWLPQWIAKGTTR
jgi:GT2 family glycosyltransferase